MRSPFSLFIFILTAAFLSGCISDEPTRSCRDGKNSVSPLSISGPLSFLNERLSEIGINREIKLQDIECYRYENAATDSFITIVSDSKEFHDIFLNRKEFPGNVKFRTKEEKKIIRDTSQGRLRYMGEEILKPEEDISDDYYMMKQIITLHHGLSKFDFYTSMKNSMPWDIMVSSDKNEPVVIFYFSF